MISTKEKRVQAVFDTPFRVVSEHEAAIRLSLSRRGLQEMRLKGEGPPFVKLGARRIGYAMSDLEAWAAARRVGSLSSAVRA